MIILVLFWAVEILPVIFYRTKTIFFPVKLGNYSLSKNGFGVYKNNCGKGETLEI